MVNNVKNIPEDTGGLFPGGGERTEVLKNP